jgi:D-amino-acid dehydrogenase
MAVLKKNLKDQGVEFRPNEAVTGFDAHRGRLNLVKTNAAEYPADEVVLAAGVWSRSLAQLLGLNLPMVGGRGYSFMVPADDHPIHHPIILSEARVAITPLDNTTIRFGGTMEITPVHTPPRLQRVQGIVDAVGCYFRDWPIVMPPADQIWQGFRPCSADGLPYIGRTRRFSNLIVATGHAMLGLSLGAGTGKLVSELITGGSVSMDISGFDPERF